jgi:predicted Zn-dependent protease
MKRKYLHIFYFLISLIVILSGCSISNKLATQRTYKKVTPFLYYYDGLTARIYGDYNRAISSLNEAKKQSPEKDAIYYELALAHAAVNNIDSAITNLNKAITLSSTNITYRTFLRALYMQSNRIFDALENQKILVQHDSTNMENEFHLALLYAEMDSLDNALRILNRIESSRGFNPIVIETKVKIYLKKQLVDEADNDLEKLLSFSPSNPFYLMYKSDILFLQGYDSDGFKLLRRIIDENPEFYYASIELYNKEINFGSKKSALEILNQIFKASNLRDEEKGRLFYPLLFEKTLYTNYHAKLDTIIITGLNIHTKSQVINEIAFEHYLRRSNFSKAEHVLQNLVEIDSINPNRYEQLINLQYSLKKPSSVITTAKAAINQFPNKSIFYIYLSIVYQENDSISDAKDILFQGVKSIEDDNELSEIYGTLGDLYYKEGDNKNAYKCYSKSINSNRNNARVLNNYSYYLALEGRNLTKALEMSTNAVTLEPNNSTYIDTKGWILFTMHKYEEAREVLRSAIAKSGSESAVINEHYGDALYKTGNVEGAYVYWLKAKELGGGSSSLDTKINTKTYVP